MTPSSASWTAASPPGSRRPTRPDTASSNPTKPPQTSSSTSVSATSTPPATSQASVTSNSARSRPPTSRPAPVTMCGHGERAASAASLLARTGCRQLGIFLGGPADWANAADAPLAPSREADACARCGRRAAGAARPAGEPGAVRAARRRQRARRRDDRPGTHRAAAARGPGVRPHRVHRHAHLHRRVRRGEGRDQLLRRHPLGPRRTQTRPRRRLDRRRARPVAVDVGAELGAGSSSPTCCSASTRD